MLKMRLLSTGLRVVGVVSALIGTMGHDLGLHAQQARQDDLKASFIVNLAKFVRWPDDSFAGPRAPVVIGIIGNDPVGPALMRLAETKTVGSRPLLVKALMLDGSLAGLHILFISESHRHQMADIDVRLRGSSTLTVGSMKDFARQGGVGNIQLVDGMFRLEANVEVAKSRGLSISSGLLSLATIVRSDQEAPRAR